MEYSGLIASVKVGEILTITEIAERVGRKPTTAFRHHIERCVARGLLRRSYGWTGKGSGWLYWLPETIAPMWKQLD